MHFTGSGTFLMHHLSVSFYMLANNSFSVLLLMRLWSMIRVNQKPWYTKQWSNLYFSTENITEGVSINFNLRLQGIRQVAPQCKEFSNLIQEQFILFHLHLEKPKVCATSNPETGTVFPIYSHNEPTPNTGSWNLTFQTYITSTLSSSERKEHQDIVVARTPQQMQACSTPSQQLPKCAQMEIRQCKRRHKLVQYFDINVQI